MPQFKSIDYSSLLHESLRDYFSVNKSGQVSFMFKFLLAVLYPLQPAWDAFETYRKKARLTSLCKWQLGQLQNVLNYLYDPTSKSIYITQSSVQNVFVPVFAETTTVFAPVFAETTTVFAPTSSDLPLVHPTTINIPAAIYGDAAKKADLIATVEAIKPAGVIYEIVMF